MISFRVVNVNGCVRIYRAWTEAGAREYPMNALEAELLLAQLTGSSRMGDWWAPYAAKMADDLAAAIAETQKPEQQEKAA